MVKVTPVVMLHHLCPADLGEESAEPQTAPPLISCCVDIPFLLQKDLYLHLTAEGAVAGLGLPH